MLNLMLVHSAEILVFLNVIPQDIDALTQLKQFSCARNFTLEFETLHQQPFPLPHYCGIGLLPTVACMVAQTHDLSQGVILQQENATPHSTSWCRRFAGSCALLLRPQEKHL
jgi:hypothetical protein